MEGELLPSVRSAGDVHRAQVAGWSIPDRTRGEAADSPHRGSVAGSSSRPYCVVVVVAGAAALIVGNTAAPPLPVTNRPAIVAARAEGRPPQRLRPEDGSRAQSGVHRDSGRAEARGTGVAAGDRRNCAPARPGRTGRRARCRFLPTPCAPPAGTSPTPSWTRSGSTFSSSRPIPRSTLSSTASRSSAARRPTGPAWLVDGWVPMSSSSFSAADALPAVLPAGTDEVRRRGRRRTRVDTGSWLRSPSCSGRC